MRVCRSLSGPIGMVQGSLCGSLNGSWWHAGGYSPRQTCGVGQSGVVGGSVYDNWYGGVGGRGSGGRGRATRKFAAHEACKLLYIVLLLASICSNLTCLLLMIIIYMYYLFTCLLLMIIIIII